MMDEISKHDQEADIQQYFQAMPPDRRLKAQTVHELVLTLHPRAQVSLKYKMPTYASEQGWLSIANQKA